MMNNAKAFGLALAIAASFVSFPANAADGQPSPREAGPVYQERVAFTDLDLRETSAQSALKRRVRRAAFELCRKIDYNYTPHLPMQRACVSEVYDQASPQIASAIRRAMAGQGQLATALVLSRAAAGG
jgi:UrcA family protein